MTLNSLRLFIFVVLRISSIRSFQLTTSSTIKGITPSELHDFLATPTNWPRIVLSSSSVKQSKSKSNRIDIPLKVGDEVEEIFGLPPLLPLGVVWKCVESSPPNRFSKNNEGRLEFYSSDGVPNLARDCRMKFLIQEVDSNKKSCLVRLDMEFDPFSPLLLVGATPVLKMDNDFALKILLPRAIKRR